MLQFKLSDFVQKFFYLNNEPFSLDDYPHMKLIYDIDPMKLCLHTSRQVAKSTTLSNFMLAKCILMPYVSNRHKGGFKILAVSPTVEQVRVFSYDRVDTVIEQSPIFKKYFVSSSTIQNVFQKRFLNGSVIYLRYGSATADRIRGISADMNCFDANTEILTENGWKLFKNLLDDERVATVNDKTGMVEYHLPDMYIQKAYQGKLVKFTQRSFNLCVTPDHIMNVSQELSTGYYQNPKVKGWFNIKAQQLAGKNFKLGVRGNWESANPVDFKLPEQIVANKLDGSPYKYPKKIPSFSAPLKIFMQFMGWFLAEGYISPAGQIRIIQNEGAYSDEIRHCLTAMGVKWGVVARHNKNAVCNTFYFANAALSRYLYALGTSHDKYIPRELLNYIQYLPDLLNALYKGDAMHVQDFGHNGGQLVTASIELANTVQEAWLRLGYLCSIRSRKPAYNGTILYNVGRYKKDSIIFWNGYTNNSRIEYIDYIGPVYCVGVKNHLIFVRDAIEKLPIVCHQCLDEIQDIPDDNIDVIEQTMARSFYKHSIYAGTPKHIIGPLANRWRQTTRNEWIAKCQHCEKQNFLDEENIQPWGLACRYCKMSLDARNGQWVRTNPESDKSIHDGSYLFEGFRVSVLMFAHAPWVNWQTDVYIPFQTKSKGVFFNEYLGLPYDAGVAPVTEEEIKACCTGGPMIQEPDRRTRDYPTFMGMDWGPINSEMSKTLMTISQRRGDVTEIIYLHKYEGKEADYAYLHEHIPAEYYRWGCALIGADAGFGEAVNAEVRNRINDKTRLIAFQHVPNQKQRGQFNGHIQAYTLSRNTVMTDLFTKIKQRKIVFPQWSDFQYYAKDILAIAIEYNEEKNTYRYIKSAADDTFHSILYGDLAAELYYRASAFNN